MSSSPTIHELASGDIAIWLDENGVICIKTRNEFDDPIELAEHEALELAELLISLLKHSEERK